MVCRPVLKPLKGEQESRLQIQGTDDSLGGSLIERKRNTILVRSKEL